MEEGASLPALPSSPEPPSTPPPLAASPPSLSPLKARRVSAASMKNGEDMQTEDSDSIPTLHKGEAGNEEEGEEEEEEDPPGHNNHHHNHNNRPPLPSGPLCQADLDCALQTHMLPFLLTPELLNLSMTCTYLRERSLCAIVQINVHHPHQIPGACAQASRASSTLNTLHIGQGQAKGPPCVLDQQSTLRLSTALTSTPFHQLSQLCLSGTFLRDQAMARVANVIQHLPSLEALNLSYLPVIHGLADLATVLEGEGGPHKLRVLDVSGTPMASSESLERLGRALARQPLKALRMEGVGGPQALYHLLLGVMDGGGGEGHHVWKELEELWLGQNRLGHGGVVALSHAMVAGRFPQLQRLKLGYDLMEAEGFGSLCTAAQRCDLQELQLNQNPGIGRGQGISTHLHHLLSSCPHLQVLDLVAVGLDQDKDAVMALAKALTSHLLTSLRVLDLSFNYLKTDRSSILVQALTTTSPNPPPQLTTLKLGQVALTPEDIHDLCLACCRPHDPFGPALEELSLDSVGLRQQGVEYLAEVLRRGGLPALSHLSLSRNGIGPEACQALAAAVGVREVSGWGLRHVDLTGNGALQEEGEGVEAVVALRKALTSKVKAAEVHVGRSRGKALVG